MMEAEQATVLRADEDAAVGLGHIQEQSRSGAGRVAQRHTGLDIVEGRVVGLVRQLCIGSDARHRTVHDKAIRATLSADQAQFAHSAVLVGAAQVLHITRNKLNPPRYQFLLEEGINSLRGRKG